MNPDHSQNQGNPAQSMDNTLGNVSIQGDSSSFTFAPVQIGTQIQTQIIQISAERITQRELNKSSPYKGLQRFNFSDREYFFGRDALIARLFEAINKNKFLLVAGASGCGKSSVVRAGLIPELKANLGVTKLFDFVFTPGRSPFESLYRSLLAEGKDYYFSEDDAEIARVVDAQTLVDVIRAFKQDDDRWLIFIDQFEEIFTNCSDEEIRQSFIDALMQLHQDNDDSVRVALAMRADFLEYFSAYPQLGLIANNNNIHLVTDMHPDELRKAIEQPAAKHGVVFEEGLVEQIVKEVQGQSGYLPLLQYTLNLLWETECKSLGQDGKPHIEDRTLNQSTYAALEGVRGALQARINKLYQQLDQDGQDATRQIFLRLVQIVDTESGSRAVSRKAFRTDFEGETIETTLQKFVNENMVVSGYEYSSQDRILTGGFSEVKRNATYEIAHEIILSSWDALKNWLEEAKDAIIFKNLLADDVHRWQTALDQISSTELEDADKAKEELLKGSRLDRAVELRESNAFVFLGGLTELENQLIDASLEWQALQRRRRAELDTEKERNQLLTEANHQAKKIIRSGVISLAVIIPVALGASLIAVQAFRGLAIARAGTKLEQAGVSALRQLRSGEIDALLSALNAAQELQNLVSDNTPLEEYPAVSPVLALQKITDSIYEKNRFPADQEEIKATDFHPDGNSIITGGEDGTIKLWRLSGELLKEFQAHEGGPLASVNAVSFSPDGRYIASASEDGTARIWTDSGDEVSVLSGHRGAVKSLDFSSNGQKIATVDSSGEVFVWDTSGNQLSQLAGHQGEVHQVAFSPDDQKIAIATADGTIRVWEASGAQLAQWSGHGGEEVYSIEFSRDGQKLISAGGDKTARIWSLSGQQQLVLEGHRLLVTNASFGDGDKLVATASDDGTARLWNLDGEELAVFQGHRGTVWNAKFSPNGAYLITTGRDSTARLWQLTRAAAPSFEGLQDDANTVSVSQDGSTIAAAGNEGIVSLWDKSGTLLNSWTANPRGHIFSIALSPDGQRVATGGIDNNVSIWSLSGEKVEQAEGHGFFVNSLSFSPDGRFLASAGADGQARLLTADGDEIAILTEHGDVASVVAFSPDSSMIATASWDGGLRLWDTAGQLIEEWQAHSDKISGLDFSPDSKLVATADKTGTVRLWITNGQQKLEFFSYQSGVNALRFIPNTKLISTGGMDGTVRLWDLTGRQIAEFTHQEGAIWGLAPTSDGQSILSGGDSGEVRLWEIQQLQDAISQGCNWLEDYLNLESQDTSGTSPVLDICSF
jgi:WD40 repeat protein/energy-coupling factor transporter ATP-binding protein EcfA2